MTESITYSRPYAEAAYKIASESKSIPMWTGNLMTLSEIIVDMQVKAIIASPKIDSNQTLGFLVSFLPRRDESFSNFLSIMISNKKVYYLDEVYKLFNDMVLEDKNTTIAEVETAFALTDTQKSNIVSSLSKKHDKKTPSNRDKWVPDKDVIDQINEYGIPEDFANLQIDDFKKLNQERNEKDINWGVKFLRFVIKKWRHKEVEDNKKMKTKPIDKNWVPDLDAKEILINSGINEDFIDKEVPEFVLYWTERKEESDIWNSKFIAHIRRQWGRFKDIKENDNSPSVMSSDWNPNSDFFDILEMTDIPKEFAENAKLEFVMYWKESGQSLNSWNSKFLQHVKYQWERTNKGQTPQLSKQIDKRIESSWEIQDSSLAKPSKKLDAEKLQENFKKLKEKHQI